MRPLAFIDLETTGATASTDRITEIGIVEVDADGTVREWQQLVNPGTPISPFIEQLTGISNAMVAGAPPFHAVADEARRRLDGRLFIAHNAGFDYGFLKSEFKRLGIVFRAPVLCTVKLSRALFPEHKRHNLDALIERHGLQAAARHRALADAQLIHQFWQKIHVDRSPEQIAAALQAQNANPSLPPHFDASLVDDLPDTPGVYLFYGDNAAPLYVAQAKDIRKQVLAHFPAGQPSARDKALAAQARRIEWIETAGEIGAQLKAAALLKQLQPSANRPARKIAGPPQPAAWPFAGPALIREGDEAHLVDGWRYLGTARSDDALHQLLAAERPPFDREIYRILAKYLGRMSRLPSRHPPAAA